MFCAFKVGDAFPITFVLFLGGGKSNLSQLAYTVTKISQKIYLAVFPRFRNYFFSQYSERHLFFEKQFDVLD